MGKPEYDDGKMTYQPEFDDGLQVAYGSSLTNGNGLEVAHGYDKFVDASSISSPSSQWTQHTQLPAYMQHQQQPQELPQELPQAHDDYSNYNYQHYLQQPPPVAASPVHSLSSLSQWQDNASAYSAPNPYYHHHLLQQHQHDQHQQLRQQGGEGGRAWRDDRRILGMRRKVALIIFAVVVVLAVVATGVGLGVGLNRRARERDEDGNGRRDLPVSQR